MGLYAMILIRNLFFSYNGFKNFPICIILSFVSYSVGTITALTSYSLPQDDKNWAFLSTISLPKSVIFLCSSDEKAFISSITPSETSRSSFSFEKSIVPLLSIRVPSPSSTASVNNSLRNFG